MSNTWYIIEFNILVLCKKYGTGWCNNIIVNEVEVIIWLLKLMGYLMSYKIMN